MPKVKYSDFFQCYFVIYHDPLTGKCLTERCKTQQDVDEFRDSITVGRELWYNKN